MILLIQTAESSHWLGEGDMKQRLLAGWGNPGAFLHAFHHRTVITSWPEILVIVVKFTESVSVCWAGLWKCVEWTETSMQPESYLASVCPQFSILYVPTLSERLSSWEKTHLQGIKKMNKTSKSANGRWRQLSVAFWLKGASAFHVWYMFGTWNWVY